MSPDVNQPQNVDEVIKKGNEIYDTLNETLDLERTLSGKYITIDVESREYFMGETRDEAIKNARQKFPNVILFARKIGELDRVARNHPVSGSNAMRYARLF
jgi:hypothetical protein